ncbi:ABC transporter permease subunit, partial [Acidisoma sp. L85]|uniref:ABC transporter permease subunit n=1 Tax=Acidisoma sp. L85 TaxID=1641850 RepID=UPI001C20AB10
GLLDSVLMRLADITLSFPPILLAMAIAASLGPGLLHTAIALIIVWWPIYARLMRAQVINVKGLDQSGADHRRAADRGADAAQPDMGRGDSFAPGRSNCWNWSRSRCRSGGSTSIRMNFRAACASEWSSPLPSPMIRNC